MGERFGCGIGGCLGVQDFGDEASKGGKVVDGWDEGLNERVKRRY